MNNNQKKQNYLDEKIENPFAERDRMFDEMEKDPKRMLYECYDVQDRQHFKVGEFEPIYDPGFGKVETVGHIATFYGKDILRRLKKEQKESLDPESKRKKNHVSQELYREMKTIRETKRPQKKSEKINSNKPKLKAVNNPELHEIKQNLQREMQPGDEYFLKTRRGMIRNENYRELFKGPNTVYEWLWSKIARHGWKDTKDYPIKEKYFDNGFLAYSTSIREIGKQCGMSKSTVAKYLKMFEEAGVLRIEHLQPKGKLRGQNVFILGEWRDNNGRISETLYRDQVFLSE